MKRMLAGAAIAAVFGLCACEGMAPGGYGDMPEDSNTAAARAAIPPNPVAPNPMPPRPMSLPNGQPAPGAIPQVMIPKPPAPRTPAPVTSGPSRITPPPATGGPSKMPAPPTAPPPFPPRVACSLPNISIRKEIIGAVEINCGPPPAPVPAGMNCKAGEQLTYLTRNGASSYQCMK